MELEKRKLRLKTTDQHKKSNLAAATAAADSAPAPADEGKLISVKRMELISFVDSIRWKK